MSAVVERFEKTYKIRPGLEEDRVWSQDIAPRMHGLPPNVLTVWQFCFTEMFNNAIDHSDGDTVSVDLERSDDQTLITIFDDGVGIFAKIQAALRLPDERQAVLELAKGKFTTDPSRHSGQGIFFTSRMLDAFSILSGTVNFLHEAGTGPDWILEEQESVPGTLFYMALDNASKRTTVGVFGEFREGETFGFDRTVVPVALAKYGNDQLISRSQAKRVLARVDQFQHVVFDFANVPMVGQAFADEIFRVFAKSNSNVKLTTVRANREVQQVIQAAQAEYRRQVKAERRGQVGRA